MVIPIDTMKMVNNQLTATASASNVSIKYGSVGLSILLFNITVNVPNRTDITTSHFECILLISIIKLPMYFEYRTILAYRIIGKITIHETSTHHVGRSEEHTSELQS